MAANQAFLLPEKTFIPFDEDAEPKHEKYNTYWLSADTQWLLVKIFWAFFVIWNLVFIFTAGPGENMGWFTRIINNWAPLFPFFALAVPISQSLISYRVPNVGHIMLIGTLVTIFPLINWQCGTIYLIGYLACIFMSFMFKAIHNGGAATENDNMDWGATLLQPWGLAFASGLMYLWQFSIHFPLNYKLRWMLGPALLIYKYTKENLEQCRDQWKGTAPPYNPEEFRTYKINDAQYIRINAVRVMILMAISAYSRMLEETICPAQEWEIDGGIITWGDFKLFPFKYIKTVPVCAW